MLRTIKLFFLTSFFSLFFFSCANISAPTGGPKDTTPPKLIKSKPSPNSLNYSGRTIELTFSENVTAQNLQEQLLITPLEENTFKSVQRKNKVLIQFEKDLTPNTTYTLNFRDGIKDITEGNSAQNLIIPFSTGNYLDSTYTNGNLLDLQTNKIPENILVSLYKSGDTLNPINSKPLYLTKSTKGNFQIQNIKAGTYDLYAVEDKNKNLKYEESEMIAFSKNVKLDSSKGNLKLNLARFDSKGPEVKYMKSTMGQVEIQLNEGITKATITDANKKDALFNIAPNGKSIFLYNAFKTIDSIPLNIQLEDSTGNKTQKDIKIYFNQDKKDPDPYVSLQFQPSDKKLDPKKIDIRLLFNKPITVENSAEIIIKEDTVTQDLKTEERKWLSNTEFQIIKNTKAKDSVTIIVPSKTFKFLDTFNMGEKERFTFKQEDKYAIVSGRIKTDKPSYIIELLDKNYKVIKRLINPTTFTFNYIEPGSYYLRAIDDENKNQKWDTGNIKESRQPEMIYFFKDKIELRANWEIQDLVFTF